MTKTKREMLCEIYEEDYDFFNNTFDVKGCALAGAERIRFNFVYQAYKSWKEVKE